MSDFRERLVHHIPALRAYARMLLRSSEAADELVQDCLLRAIEKNHLWKRGTDLKAWLFTMMHRLFINDYRRRARRPTVPLEDERVGALGGPRQLDHMVLQQVKETLHTLPDEQREAIILVAMQGFSYQRAADILGAPVGTIRSRVSRARATLRDAMVGSNIMSQRDDSLRLFGTGRVPRRGAGKKRPE